MPKTNLNEESLRTKTSSWRRYLLYTLMIVVGLPVIAIAIFFGLLYVGEANASPQVESILLELESQDLPINDETLAAYQTRQNSSARTEAWLGVLKKLQSADFVEQSKQQPILGDAVEMPLPQFGMVFAPNASDQLPLESNVDGYDAPDDESTQQSWDENATREFLLSWKTLVDEIYSLSNAQLTADMPVYFPREYRSVHTTLDNVKSMRHAGELLQLHGRLALHDKNSKGVRESVLAIIGCAETLEGDPVLAGAQDRFDQPSSRPPEVRDRVRCSTAR